MTSTIDSVELIRTLEQALRAGFSLRQGLARAANDFDNQQLTAVADAAMNDAPLTTLFTRWIDPDIDLLAGAVQLQVESGANLADTLSVLHLVMARRPDRG